MNSPSMSATNYVTSGNILTSMGRFPHLNKEEKKIPKVSFKLSNLLNISKNMFFKSLC